MQMENASSLTNSYYWMNINPLSIKVFTAFPFMSFQWSDIIIHTIYNGRIEFYWKEADQCCSSTVLFLLALHDNSLVSTTLIIQGVKQNRQQNTIHKTLKFHC